MELILRKCGSVHPNNPKLICESIGKCMVDFHHAVITHSNGFSELVYWGKAAESLQSKGPLSCRVIPIQERKK